MRSLPTVLAAVFVVAVMLFYMCTFQVRSTEVAIKKRFGNPTGETITDARLYFKWPYPINSVVKIDKRIRVLEDSTEETITADSKNVIVTTSTFWTIEDLKLFHNSFDTVEQCEQQLRNAIRSQKKAVVGQYDFSNFVSTRPGERKLREMEEEILSRVRDVWRTRYGVDLRFFGITKLTLPQNVTVAIFESMKKNEQNKADAYEAEGRARAEAIVASAQASQERIMSVATRKADEIRNQGRRAVSEIYRVFTEHPELRIFLDKLNALEQMLRNDTTIFLNNETAPVDLFNEAAIGGNRSAGLKIADLHQE